MLESKVEKIKNPFVKFGYMLERKIRKKIKSPLVKFGNMLERKVEKN
jgi:hypothetical protein